MNLVNGKVVTQQECDKLLETLEDWIYQTLEKPPLDPFVVIEACGCLSKRLDEAAYEEILKDMGILPTLVKEYLSDAKTMLSEAYLRNKLKTELGEGYGKPYLYQPADYDKKVKEQILPLGVLFHIVAGNMDGLPAFTVIEGLLTGNINILKLPAEEGGLSVGIFLELFKLAPELAEYVYVFDYSSKDEETLRRLADLADAIVLWGGDSAVRAVREMAKPHTKIIEWGHKISFAYVSGTHIPDEALEGIADNICRTNQLLCSSCQGIFMDTPSMEEVYQFCQRFLPILESKCKVHPALPSVGIEAGVGLKTYTAQIEALFTDTKIYAGTGCSVTAYTDSRLTSSIMFRNPWVRRLPQADLLRVLRPYKNYVQTIGLVCTPDETEGLSDKLWKTGAVRVTDGRHMPKTYSGAPHDGEYPLRRYTKIVALES